VVEKILLDTPGGQTVAPVPPGYSMLSGGIPIRVLILAPFNKWDERTVLPEEKVQRDQDAPASAMSSRVNAGIAFACRRLTIPASEHRVDHVCSSKSGLGSHRVPREERPMYSWRGP